MLVTSDAPDAVPPLTPPPPHLRPPLDVLPVFRHPRYTLAPTACTMRARQVNISLPDGPRVMLAYQRWFHLGLQFGIYKAESPRDELLTLTATDAISLYPAAYLVTVPSSGTCIGMLARRHWGWMQPPGWLVCDPDGGGLAAFRVADAVQALLYRFVMRSLVKTYQFTTSYNEALAHAQLGARGGEITMPTGGATNLLDPRLALAVAVLHVLRA